VIVVVRYGAELSLNIDPPVVGHSSRCAFELPDPIFEQDLDITAWNSLPVGRLSPLR
jgi:hypothetical protein